MSVIGHSFYSSETHPGSSARRSISILNPAGLFRNRATEQPLRAGRANLNTLLSILYTRGDWRVACRRTAQYSALRGHNPANTEHERRGDAL
jgi:hypothetical protein